MTKRSGFTLLEMVIVISILAVILPMAGSTLFFLMRAQSQSADALRDAMAITQLSHAFRTDVHAARSARPAQNSQADQAVILELDGDRLIEYRAEANDSVSRTVRRGETVERSERFRVGAVHPRFALGEGGLEVAITLSPHARGSVAAERSRPTTAGIRIAAIIGRNATIGTIVANPDSTTSAPPISTTPPKAAKR
jgi:prepilin-type N-terminal cleavage/methylation domain-containing protein